MNALTISCCLFALMLNGGAAFRHYRGSDGVLSRFVNIQHEMATQRDNSLLHADVYSTSHLQAYGVQPQRIFASFHHRSKRSTESQSNQRAMCKFVQTQITADSHQTYLDRNLTEVQLHASNTFNVVMCEHERESCSNVDTNSYMSACETQWSWQYALVKKDAAIKIAEVLVPWSCDCTLQEIQNGVLNAVHTVTV